MRNWLKKYRTYLIAVCMLAIIAAFIIAMYFRLEAACGSPSGKKMLSSSSGLNCIEFWFFRYQTLIIGLLTLTAALWAAIAVFQQRDEMRRQNQILRAELDAKQEPKAEEARKKASELSNEFWTLLGDRNNDVIQKRQQRIVGLIFEINQLAISAGEALPMDRDAFLVKATTLCYDIGAESYLRAGEAHDPEWSEKATDRINTVCSLPKMRS